jgi:putative ABC transport system permease protein
MSAILIKIKADLVSRPLMSILILVTIVTSSVLLTLALTTLLNISGPYDSSFRQLNAAHVWLYFSRGQVDKEEIARIEALPGVEASTGLSYQVITRARIGDERTWVTLKTVPAENATVNRLMVQEGRFLEQQAVEAVASNALKQTHGLAAGDDIEITLADGTKRLLPVVGLVYDPMWDWYASEQPPQIYVTTDILRTLYPHEAGWGWALGLRLAEPHRVKRIVALVESIVGSEGLVSHADWRDIRESALFNTRINFVFLGAFSFFAILATVLVVASSIGSIVLSQFRQIGILKAIGFTQGQTVWLYLGQYLALSLIGAPLGLMIGALLAPLPLNSVAIALNTTYRPPVDLVLVLSVLVTITVIVLLACLGAALRGARANIIRSIAVGAEAPRRKPPRPVRWATRAGLPSIFLLSLNDLYARPGRSLITGVNLAIGVIGIVFGLAASATVNTYMEKPELLGIAHDALVTRETLGHTETRELLENAPGVAAFYGERRVQVETVAGQAFEVKAVDDDLAAFPIRIEEGKLLHPDGFEAIAGRGLLDWLDLQVGDQITLRVGSGEGDPVSFEIVGQYTEPADRGRMLTVNLPAIENLIGNAEPETYYVKLDDGADRDELKRYLEPADNSDLNVAFVEGAVPEDVRYLEVAVFGLSAILIGIASINVFNTSLLAVREKVRVVGILKTVGMTPGQVVTMVAMTAGLLGIQSALIGIPVGLLVTGNLLEMLSASYGFGQIDVTLNPLYLALLVPAMVVVSMAGSLMPGLWAAKSSIVHVLRSE